MKNKHLLLQNKVALITGASRGIGKAIAEEFCHHGAKVILIARSKKVIELAEGLKKAGFQAEAYQGDVQDTQQNKAVLLKIKKEYGKLDILVNNAGVLFQSPLGMISTQKTEELFKINIFSMIDLTQSACRLMKGSGSIINLASIAGVNGIAGLTAYSASKAAVEGFTRSAAKELAARNIRVNAIAPGLINTDMAKTLSDEWLAKRIENIGLARIGEPKEVADCAVFLASDMSSYITGQTIGVDGAMIV